nr:PAAR-like domain-containing protein [Halorhodospira halophila]
MLTTDVCRTTVGSSTVSIPYLNVAESRDAAETARTVFVEGHPVCTEASQFARSRGDEGGDQGGTVSGTITGPATFLPGSGSPDVFVEGVPVARALDAMVANHENTPPAPLLQEQLPPTTLTGGDPPPDAEPRPRTRIDIGGGPQAPLPGEVVVEPASGGWHRSRALRWSHHDGERWGAAIEELPEGTEALQLSLIDADRRHHLCKVPLTRGAEQPAWLPGEEPEVSPPTVLIPTLVRFARDAELRHRDAGFGFGGWLYLFRREGDRRYLWRECYVHPRGRLHEVNLAYEHGDLRRPTGDGRPMLLLPLRIGGEPVVLEGLFSAVQLPWARIAAAGGLAPDDPRAGVHGEPDGAAEPPPEARFFPIELTEDPDTGPGAAGRLGGSGAFRDAVAEEGESEPVREDLAPYAEDGLALLYLDDPLGEARGLAHEQAALADRLETLVAGLQTGTNPERSTVGEGEGDPQQPDEQWLAAAESLHAVAAGTFRLAFVEERLGPGEQPPDRELLERLLGVAERSEIRAEIRRVRRKRLALLSSQRYADALADYAGNTPRRVFEGLAALGAHFRELAVPADTADGYIGDIPAAEGEAEAAELDQARALLRTVLEAEGDPSGLARVAARLLAAEPLTLGAGARGGGLPRPRRELELQLAAAPRRLQAVERCCDLAEQRRAVTAEDAAEVLYVLLSTFAESVSYQGDALEHVMRITCRFQELPGLALLAGLEVTTVSYPAPDFDGVPLAEIQRRAGAPTGGEARTLRIEHQGYERRFRILAAGSDDYHAAVADAGRGPVQVLGSPLTAELRIEDEIRVRELRSTRLPEGRLADLAERLSTSSGGHALRSVFGALELINLNQAVRQTRTEAWYHIASAVASSLTLAELLAQTRLAYLKPRIPVGDPRYGRIERLGLRAQVLGGAAAFASAIYAAGRGYSRSSRGDEVASRTWFVAGLAYLGAGGFWLAGSGGVGLSFLLVAVGASAIAGYVSDTSFADFCRNGPFTPTARERLGGSDRDSGWAWVARAVEVGPPVQRPAETGSWDDWPAVAAWWQRVLHRPPLRVAAEYSQQLGGRGALRQVRLTLAGVAWRRDRLECRVLLCPEDGACQEVTPLPPAFIKAAPGEGSDALTVTLAWDALPTAPGWRGELCFLIRQRAVAGAGDDALPEPEADGTPRYWVARVPVPAWQGRAKAAVAPRALTVDEVLREEAAGSRSQG